MIGWIDASSGASGDMLLAATVDAGADRAAVEAAVAAVAPEATALSSQRVRRAGLAALKIDVEVADSARTRGLADVLALIDDAAREGEGEAEPDQSAASVAALDHSVAWHARAVFISLAEAEAAVHGVITDEVHFHEVGALDAIADVVGACAGLVSLGLDELHCSPVAVGSGEVQSVHGRLSVPPPAVARLLTDIPTYAGPAATELCTPTGAALLSHWVTSWGAQPPMLVQRVGTGAGTREFDSHPNVVRLFVGPRAESRAIGSLAEAQAARATPPGHVPAVTVYETNVDDLDPRLWPAVLQRLLAAGASDAWLTPIVMKKGRPAYTLSVLLPEDLGARIREVIFSETSAIGMREQRVTKHALEREFDRVEVRGEPIAVKIARVDGTVVNVQPEYDDVLAAAAKLDRPVKAVLAEAVAAAASLWE